MKEFASKLNLYEILSMLIPGSAIMLFLIIIKFHDAPPTFPTGFNDEAVLAIIWFVLAYLVGLMHNIFMDWWWKPFRNNPVHISYIYNQLKEKAEKRHMDTYSLDLNAKDGCCMFSCPCFFLRATFILIVTILSPVWRFFCRCMKGTNIADGMVIDQYYKTYYKAEQRPNSAIRSLEQQVVFMRNMLFPLILLAPQLLDLLVTSNEHITCYNMLVSLFIICLAFCIVKRQEKIYSCVFEDAEYLKD